MNTAPGDRQRVDDKTKLEYCERVLRHVGDMMRSKEATIVEAIAADYREKIAIAQRKKEQSQRDIYDRSGRHN